MKPAFSAVELLLVAGISAILVAIAVPGYMEAKVKAEVADVNQTIKQTHYALISYRMDHNNFPEPRTRGSLKRLNLNNYMNKEPIDRFKEKLGGFGGHYSEPYLGYSYLEPQYTMHSKIFARIKSGYNITVNSEQNQGPWYLKSIGPDQTDYLDEGGGRSSNIANYLLDYDPTNGTFSLGEIIQVGQN